MEQVNEEANKSMKPDEATFTCSNLRRLMTFAWPCLLAKSCVDPFNKYHGHILLSHIISKFSIHKRIVLQVFHSLLKAHEPEAKLGKYLFDNYTFFHLKIDRVLN